MNPGLSSHEPTVLTVVVVVAVFVDVVVVVFVDVVVVVLVDVVVVFVEVVVIVIVDVIVVGVDVSRKTRRDKKWFPSNFRASVICLVL